MHASRGKVNRKRRCEAEIPKAESMKPMAMSEFQSQACDLAVYAYVHWNCDRK